MDVCRLTHTEGTFVRSHLLPRALTSIGKGSEKATEHEIGAGRPKRRPPGWYDSSLVNATGERFLEKYDDAGIRELRRCGLVWSSASHSQIAPEHVEDESGLGMAFVDCNKPKRLRMFFLSLLWRAAATSIPEFRHFEISTEEIERLRVLLINDDPGEPEEFQTILVCLVGDRFPHNHTPIRDKYLVADIEHTCSRIYFDGLIVRMANRFESKPFMSAPDNFFAGFQKRIGIITMDGPKSRQIRDVMDITIDSGVLFRNSPNG
jgi:hypothetical protein